MKRMWLLVAIAIVAGSACAPAGESDRTLPDAELELLDGGTYAVQQTGQARILNLWATWCAPCRAELPAFDDAAGRIEGVQIVGINVGDSGPDAAELVQELGLSFPQVLDREATIQQSLRITGMPSTIFVDADGAIVQVHSGELELDEIEAMSAELLGATFDGEQIVTSPSDS